MVGVNGSSLYSFELTAEADTAKVGCLVCVKKGTDCMALSLHRSE